MIDADGARAVDWALPRDLICCSLSSYLEKGKLVGNSFNGGFFSQPFSDQRVVSFQSGALNGTELAPRMIDNWGAIISMAGMIRDGNSNMINNASAMMLQANSPAPVIFDPICNTKHSAHSSVDWSDEELAMLKRGLIIYATETNMMKYIKIAALLPEKTVRDVAMRCRWITRKENGRRRRSEDYSAGKKIKDRKDKMVGPISIHTIHPNSKSRYSFTMHNVHNSNQFPHEVPVTESGIQHCLQENILLLNQIERNLENNEVQDNVWLFNRTKDNIASILNGMSVMPGIMSQMLPLPVSVNRDLAHSLFHRSIQEANS